MLSGSADYGKAFENWVFHELAALGYRQAEAGLSYWRLAGGTEVDFVIGEMEVALEAKSSRIEIVPAQEFAAGLWEDEWTC